MCVCVCMCVHRGGYLTQPPCVGPGISARTGAVVPLLSGSGMMTMQCEKAWGSSISAEPSQDVPVSLANPAVVEEWQNSGALPLSWGHSP